MGGTSSKKSFEYSVALPQTEKPGQSAVYVHPEWIPNAHTSLSSQQSTLHQSFKQSVAKYPDNPCLGTRKVKPNGCMGRFVWRTYSEVSILSSRLASGFSALGLNVKNSEGHAFLGILSKNREEWIVTDLACMSQDIISVPLYDVLQGESLEYILDLTEMPALVCSSDRVYSIFELKRDSKIPNLQILITFQEPGDLRAQGQNLGLQILSFLEVQALNGPDPVAPPSPDSIFTVCFTSGTTGRSKGAVLTHKNIMTVLAGVFAANYSFYNSDSHLSYLPLAHMFERVMVHIMLSVGGSIGFYGGDLVRLKDDLQTLKPTVFISVPRLFNRFHDLMIQNFKTQNKIKKMILNSRLGKKMKTLKKSGRVKSGVWDRLVFKQVKNTFGGRVRLMICGSAPVAPEVLLFLRLVFSCPVIVGYGLTETSGGSVLTHILDFECESIGGPIPVVELKLVDVPDMNYFTDSQDSEGRFEPKGEICLRGPSIFNGYYKEPRITGEVIDEEGWFHSGDIGVRSAEKGDFYVIDRKNNFFKLSQGDFVAAERIENVYLSSLMIHQIFVYGDSLQNFLIAIVVPDQEFMHQKWITETGKYSNWEDLCENPRLKQFILADMSTKAREFKLLGFEHVRKIHIEPQPWTTDDLLTPTQKLIRFKAKEKYMNIINSLYSD